MPTLLSPPSNPLYHSYLSFHSANLSKYLFCLVLSKFQFRTQGWKATHPARTLWVNELLCFSSTHSAKQPFFVSTGVAKWGWLGNLYFDFTPHSFVLKFWNFVKLNPQVFDPWIHRVLRCSFSWSKLHHISQRPYYCDMYILPDTHHRIQPPPLCRLMSRQASHIWRD